MRPRLLISLLLLVLAFGLGGWLTYQVTRQRAVESTEASATVLLEKVRQVLHLVTVEGNFSELYNEKNIRQITLYLPLPTAFNFEKSALLQVEGRVLVGYDMEGVGITVDSSQRTIRLNNLPQPEILAIDHELIYRNLDESFFNSFSPEDYTQLNRNAKNALRKKAYESGLLEKASEQGNQLIESLRFMAENVGWTLVYTAEPVTLPPSPAATN